MFNFISLLQRIVEKVIQAPMLHGHFGHIPEEEMVKTRCYYYFLRSNPEGIPLMETIEDARAEIPQSILLGSFTGRLLRNFQCLLKEVEIVLLIFNFNNLAFQCTL